MSAEEEDGVIKGLIKAVFTHLQQAQTQQIPNKRKRGRETERNHTEIYMKF